MLKIQTIKIDVEPKVECASVFSVLLYASFAVAVLCTILNIKSGFVAVFCFVQIEMQKSLSPFASS